jgi:hypothetical protein
MPKKEKSRTFESETLILPALKMVLTETDKAANNSSVNKSKKKVEKDFNQETILRIIGKLSMKE